MAIGRRPHPTNSDASALTAHNRTPNMASSSIINVSTIVAVASGVGWAIIERMGKLTPAPKPLAGTLSLDELRCRCMLRAIVTGQSAAS